MANGQRTVIVTVTGTITVTVRVKVAEDSYISDQL